MLVELADAGAGGQAERPKTAGPQDAGARSPTTAQREEPRAGADRWLSRDLHVTAGVLLNHKVAPGQHLLLGQEGFSMTVGGRQLTSRRGLVWIAPSKAADGRPPEQGLPNPGLSRRSGLQPEGGRRAECRSDGDSAGAGQGRGGQGRH